MFSARVKHLLTLREGSGDLRGGGEDALVVSEDEAVSKNAAVWDKEWARIESDSSRQGLQVGKVNGVVTGNHYEG
jgi:hypothetical protein